MTGSLLQEGLLLQQHNREHIARLRRHGNYVSPEALGAEVRCHAEGVQHLALSVWQLDVCWDEGALARQLFFLQNSEAR